LMTFPGAYLTTGQDVLAAAPWWQVGVIVTGLAGLYLTVVGWSPDRRPAPSVTATSES